MSGIFGNHPIDRWLERQVHEECEEEANEDERQDFLDRIAEGYWDEDR